MCRYPNHKNNFYAKRLMFNRFLKNSDDLQAIVLYNELTDSVNGRHKFKSEKENGVRHIIYVLLVRTT
jgi:hypothetical protein